MLGDITNTARDRGASTPQGRRPTATKKGRKTGLWTDEQLSQAIDAIENGMRIQTASDLYRIPTSSLRDHLYGITQGRKRGGKCVLTPQEEQLVVEWICRLQEFGHPVNMAALRMKVAEICQGRETPFIDGIPGRGWLRWWRRRHPELALRVAQGLETSRARGLCQENVQSFYHNLSHLYDTNSYSPDRIWNCDETGAQAGRNGGALVLARRGSRNVHQVMPDEREWLSVLVCCNAPGQTIPSFYIFKRKRFRRNYIARCETGATMAMQPRAWMTSFLFLKWISHFVKCVEPLGGVSLERRHLLILDGHCSHVSIDTVQEARRQGIDLLMLPSHTSHAMQPLDVCLFKPFKTAFKAYRDFWTYMFAGCAAKKENLAQWVSLALKRAMTVEIIKRGFKVTGIWPLDANAMSAKMGPSEAYQSHVEDVTDAPSHLQVEEIQSEVAEYENPSAHHFYVNMEGADEFSGSEPEYMSEGEFVHKESPHSISRFLTLPEVTVAQPRRRSEAIADYSKSIILTSESYVAMMEEKSALKEEIEKEKATKKQQRELEKKRREEEKAQELMNKQQRQEERARKKVFHELWSQASVAAYGQRLHDRIRSGEPLPPTAYRPRYLGFPPPICIENQRLAIERRRAKRRREDTTHIPAPIVPEWAHKSGVVLWVRLAHAQAMNPGWLKTSDAAPHIFMRPYQESGAATESPSVLPIRPEPQ